MLRLRMAPFTVCSGHSRRPPGMLPRLDAIDRQLLDLLQRRADTPLAELAQAVSLSTTPCWRRVQRLRESGLIRGQVLLLDPRRLNLGVTVFVSLRTSRHDAAWFRSLKDAVDALPEIVEFHRLSGEVDYLLRVLVPDIAAYDRVYQRLVQAVDLSDVSASFSMEEIKSTTVLPLDYLP